MMDLFVYYKVPEANAAALQARVTAMQAGLAPHCGGAPGLKRRPEASAGLHTWMEVYPAVDADFTVTLDAAARHAGLAALAAGPRHSEVFMDLSSCA